MSHIEINTEFNCFLITEKQHEDTTFLWIIAGFCETKFIKIKRLSENLKESDIEEYCKEINKKGFKLPNQTNNNNVGN